MTVKRHVVSTDTKDVLRWRLQREYARTADLEDTIAWMVSELSKCMRYHFIESGAALDFAEHEIRRVVRYAFERMNGDIHWECKPGSPMAKRTTETMEP